MEPLVTPAIRKLMDQITRNVEAREAAEGPTLYRCRACRDTGFVNSKRETGRIHADPCTECTDTGGFNADALDIGEIRAMPWEIDGDDKIRLRLRRTNQPTLWIWPDGRRCSYPPYVALRPIEVGLYRELHAEARRSRRIGQPELVVRGSR